MKIYNATYGSYGSKKGDLLAEGTAEELAEFISRSSDTDSIAKFEESDLAKNGGNWEIAPDYWSPGKPYYFALGDHQIGGFETLEDALWSYCDLSEDIVLG